MSNIRMSMDFKFLILAFFFSAVIYSTESAEKSSIVPVQLKTEYLNRPLTLETPNPRFSWKLNTRSDAKVKQNLTQTAYQILVSSSVDGANLWDSGIVKSDNTVNIKYAGKPLKSRQLASWKVKVWDQDENVAESLREEFGMGLLEKNDWKGKWINAPAGMQKDVIKSLDQNDQQVMGQLQGLLPALYFRKSFNLEEIKGARLFATAKGIYDIFLNGERLHFSQFDPGWTEYTKTIRYQSFVNVEKFLQKGENIIGVVLVPGWYSGYVGMNYDRTGKFNQYGSDIGALVQLDINDTTVVASDSTWKVNTGPIVYSDILMGETYYVNREIDGWNDVNFDDSKWSQAVTQDRNDKVELIGDVSEPVTTTKILRPKSMNESSPGVFVFDFGQNFAGYCSLSIHAEQGPTRIQLRHGEYLDHLVSGSLYTANLRIARAIDTLVIKEKVTKPFYYQPSFTYHGFRYVELSGYGIKPKLTDIVAKVIHSGFPMNSHMKTSNELVNRLQMNIEWGLRSNLVSIPTGCSQRDERSGWTGDAQTIAPTAVYNADLAAFYNKWMKDMRDSQSNIGGFPDVAPRVIVLNDGAPAWGDAGVIIPWVVYNTYGDEQIIKDNYIAMANWINYIKTVNPDFIWKNRMNNNYGDWLEVNASTNKNVLATAYYARDAMLMSKMATVIGKTEDAKMYSDLFQHIFNTFNKNYVKSDGTIVGDTQSSYVFALAFSLLPEKLRPLAAKKLVDNIKSNNMHLTTGFYGVGFLNSVLTEYGYNDIAYQLLLQETYPSWLYTIKYGNATTIWERWDSWTVAKGFQDPGMNSFNHYSFGAVGSWLYSHVAGIASDGAGFKNIIIKPNPGQGLTNVHADYDSIHGVITSSWIVNQDTVDYTFIIPVNTNATIYLPGNKDKILVGSGTWKFNAKKNF